MSGTLVDDCEVLVIGGGLTGLDLRFDYSPPSSALPTFLLRLGNAMAKPLSR